MSWSSLEMRHGLTSANISKTILACVAWGTPVKRPESQETTSSNRRHVVIRSLRIPNVVLCFKWSKTCTGGGTATPAKAPAQPFPFQESRSCPWRLFFCHHFHLLSNWLSHKANFWFFPQLTLSFSKWQVHPYKTANKLGKERNFLSLIKDIHEKLIAEIILSTERLNPSLPTLGTKHDVHCESQLEFRTVLELIASAVK